jgi:predicted O-methyltransferase YrrM
MNLKKTLVEGLGRESIEGSIISHEKLVRALLEVIKPKRALEIGTRHGVSSSLYAQYADHVITVDVEKCPDSYKEWARRVWDFLGLTDKITPFYAPGINWKGYNNSKAEFIKKQEFDFAFIDGSHKANDVKFDFDLVKKSGCVLFHDYKPIGPKYSDCNNSRYPEIVQVINHLKPAPYIYGQHRSQYALWIAKDSPRRNDPRLMTFLEENTQQVSLMTRLTHDFHFRRHLARSEAVETSEEEE